MLKNIKKISTIINSIYNFNSNCDTLVTGICSDSREVAKGDCFAALQGEKFDGANYILQAIDKGAVIVISNSSAGYIEEKITYKDKLIPHIKLPNLKQNIASIADYFYSFPTNFLDVVAVTGTNGKSSTVYMASALQTILGLTTATYGTIGYGRYDNLNNSIRTTDNSVLLQRRLAEFIADGMNAVALEVSSHAIAQGRAERVKLDYVIFTNLSDDHLDYHGTMENYAATKYSLFLNNLSAQAVVNIDCPYGMKLYEKLKELNSSPICYSLSHKVRLEHHYCYADNIKHDIAGASFELYSSWGNIFIKTRLVADFNISNLLAVIVVLLKRGYSLDAIKNSIELMPSVPGRMQFYTRFGLPNIIVDYAHTEDAVTKVCEYLRPLVKGKLNIVFGSGGERYIIRRCGIGEAADKYCDNIFITADNPRAESLDKINNDILQGITDKSKVTIINDRKQAIIKAISSAHSDDTIIIIGKGHENYQEIAGVRYSYSDLEVVNDTLNSLEGVIR